MLQCYKCFYIVNGNGSMQCCHVIKQIELQMLRLLHALCNPKNLLQQILEFQKFNKFGQTRYLTLSRKNVETTTHLQKKSDTGATVKV